MVIDRIGNINKVIGPEKVQNQKVAKVNSNIGEDTVSISKEAQKAQEVAQVQSFVKETPDVRQDRIKEVKEKMSRGDYDRLDSELLDRIADKIAQALIRS